MPVASASWAAAAAEGQGRGRGRRRRHRGGRLLPGPDRIKIGDPATLADRLLAAWQHDQDQGLDSLMLAPSRRQVVDLNQRARAARLAGTHLRKSARLTIQTTNAPVAQHDLSRVRASEPGVPLVTLNHGRSGD